MSPESWPLKTSSETGDRSILVNMGCRQYRVVWLEGHLGSDTIERVGRLDIMRLVPSSMHGSAMTKDVSDNQRQHGVAMLDKQQTF